MVMAYCRADARLLHVAVRYHTVFTDFIQIYGFTSKILD
jgi:hypothetical protein